MQIAKSCSFQLQLSSEGQQFRRYFHYNGKLFKPKLLSVLKKVCASQLAQQLFQHLLALAITFLAHQQSQPSLPSLKRVKRGDAEQNCKNIRKCYSAILLRFGQILPDSHPYLLGIMTYSVSAKLISEGYDLAAGQLFDLHHKFHLTVFGVKASNPYIFQFLSKCFPVETVLQQLEELRPKQKQVKQENKVLSQYSRVNLDQLKRSNLPQLKQVLGQLARRNTSFKNEKKEYHSSGKSVLAPIRRYSKQYFDLNRLSAAVQQQLKCDVIPYKTSQLVCLKQTPHPEKRKDESKTIRNIINSIKQYLGQKMDPLAMPGRDIESWSRLLNNVRSLHLSQGAVEKSALGVIEENLPKIQRPQEKRKTVSLHQLPVAVPQQCFQTELLPALNPLMKKSPIQVNFLSSSLVPASLPLDQKRVKKKNVMQLRRNRIIEARQQLNALLSRPRSKNTE